MSAPTTTTAATTTAELSFQQLQHQQLQQHSNCGIGSSFLMTAALVAPTPATVAQAASATANAVQ
jgi:hypothetical protein